MPLFKITATASGQLQFEPTFTGADPQEMSLDDYGCYVYFSDYIAFNAEESLSSHGIAGPIIQRGQTIDGTAQLQVVNVAHARHCSLDGLHIMMSDSFGPCVATVARLKGLKGYILYHAASAAVNEAFAGLLTQYKDEIEDVLIFQKDAASNRYHPLKCQALGRAIATKGIGNVTIVPVKQYTSVVIHDRHIVLGESFKKFRTEDVNSLVEELDTEDTQALQLRERVAVRLNTSELQEYELKSAATSDTHIYVGPKESPDPVLLVSQTATQALETSMQTKDPSCWQQFFAMFCCCCPCFSTEDTTPSVDEAEEAPHRTGASI